MKIETRKCDESSTPFRIFLVPDSGPEVDLGFGCPNEHAAARTAGRLGNAARLAKRLEVVAGWTARRESAERVTLTANDIGTIPAELVAGT